MPRNGSGSFSLTSGNPVIPGTLITSTWANTTLPDIASALTASVARDGQSPMQADLPMGNNKVTGMTDGVALQDGATVNQLGAISSNLANTSNPALGAALIGNKRTLSNAIATNLHKWIDGQPINLVADCGADPTGVNDSAPALNLALSLLPINGFSRSIYLPAGKYKFNSLITYSFPNSATGPSNNTNSYAQVRIYGDGADETILYFPTGNGLLFNCSSFQHIVNLDNFSLTTGGIALGTALKITNTYPYFGEYNANHHINITIRGDDGYGNSFYWTKYIDLFNVSNLSFGKNCLLSGAVAGASSNTAGTGISIASSATPGGGTSTEPGWGTGYDLTGVKIKFMGRGIEIGAGVQGFSLGAGTEILVGYDGIHVLSGVTEVRQINLIGMQISVNGDAVYFDSGVPSCNIVGNYIGVAVGKNGIVFATDTGAANGGGTNIIGNTFVAEGSGTGDGIYANTTFMPINIMGNTFVGLSTGVEITSAGQNISVGPNQYANCTNSVINISASLTNKIDSTNLIGNGMGFGESVTQLTSKATAVSINSPGWRVTTSNSALGANAITSFALTNTMIGIKDVVAISSSNGNYNVWTSGLLTQQRTVFIQNITAGSLSDAITLNFVIIKASQ